MFFFSLTVQSHVVETLDNTQYLLSLKLHLSQPDADQFCRQQFGGNLATKAQTEAAHDLFDRQRGHLPSSVHNLWIGQNVIHTGLSP